MTVSLVVPDVKVLDVGLWRAKLAPEDLHFLGAAAARSGPLSILIVSEAVFFDRAANALSFSSAFARVLNLGDSHDAIIVESRSPSEAAIQSSLPMFTIKVLGQSARPISVLQTPSNGGAQSISQMPKRKASVVALAKSASEPIELIRRRSIRRREG